MPQRVLAKESRQHTVAEEFKSVSVAAESPRCVSENSSVPTNLQTRLDDFVKSRLGDPVWVEKSIEKDLESHGLRIKLGELTNNIYEAKRIGDEKGAKRLLRELTLVKQILSKL